MLSIGETFTTPWGFSAECVDVTPQGDGNPLHLKDFTFIVLDGPLQGATYRVEIKAREQDQSDTKLRRVRLKVVEGPPPLLGLDRWISATSFVSA